MTVALSGKDIASKIEEAIPQAITSVAGISITVKCEQLFQVAKFLKDSPRLEFDFLVNISGVDYLDHIEVVYHLVSLKHNHSLVLKTICLDRDNPVVPSVVSLWRGADLLEREEYDLVGIHFEGHPNLKRIYLWEGFLGHPLRRDYL
jgi:NADH-quinone oxidoreductase subunit C